MEGKKGKKGQEGQERSGALSMKEGGVSIFKIHLERPQVTMNYLGFPGAKFSLVVLIKKPFCRVTGGWPDSSYVWSATW